MKTIEEKAAAYDRALEVLRKYDGAHIMLTQDLKEEMFPELKESGDEMIKQELKHYLEVRRCQTNSDEEYISCNKFLSWLEKQGEQKPAEQSPFTFDDILALQCAMTNAKESDEKLYEALRSLHDRVHDIYHGEQQGSEEPTDKPEPKFNSGDWVVLSTSDGEKVVQIDFIEYFKSGEPRYITSEGRWFGNGTKAHLWAIQDAKDGDVLMCNINKADIGGDIEKLPNITPTVCIYQNVVKDKDYIHTYCSLYNGSSLVLSNSMYYNTFVYNIHPATKEQRDTLTKAMADAGYTFDFEKKELKKIAQKPAETHVDWSEEDYNEIETIACHLDNTDNEGMAEVLRNIRDKYYHTIPQTTWKPSDEQMEALLSEVTAWTKGCPKQKVLESLYNDLRNSYGI